MTKRIETNQESEQISKRSRLIEQEEIMDSKKAIQKFKEILKNAQTTGEYSVSGEASELPIIPNIHVNNFGPISFPLNDLQANDLFKVFHFCFCFYKLLFYK